MSGFLFSVCNFAFVGVDAHIDPIKITNSPKIFVKQHILPGRCGHRPLRPSIEQRLSEFHTSNIQRAQTEQLALNIVRLGNPIRRPDRRAFLAGRAFGERHAEAKCFFRRVSAISFSSASFLPILFWQDRKEWAAGGNLCHSDAKRPAARAAGQNARIKEECRSTRARAWRCC